MTAYDQITRGDLLALPRRPWQESAVYDSLIVFPSRQKHDSGWGCMTVVGCRDLTPIQLITTSMDDLRLDSAVNIDCLHRAKALHIWRPHHAFRVPHSLSSINISVIGAAA